MYRTLAHHIFRPCHIARFYSNTWEEIRIPVPWGHVAGKWWGPKDKRPILTTHGWLDNSGSFDTLIPLLPKTSSFLAIDFPGCGYSSKLPPGVLYHVIDSVTLIKRIVEHFKWEKVSLLGHSLGSLVNYIYTMLFPEEVDFLICLDAFCPPPQDGKIVERMREGILTFLKNDYVNSLNEEPPNYTYQEMEQKLHGNFFNSVDVDKCKYILQRCILPSNQDAQKYYFTMDPRVKVWDLLRWPEEEIVETANRFTCPILLMKASRSPFFGNKQYATRVIDVISKNNKNFLIYDVEGAHHLHLNNPEKIEHFLNDFIGKFDVLDRTHSGFKIENVVVNN